MQTEEVIGTSWRRRRGDMEIHTGTQRKGGETERW